MSCCRARQALKGVTLVGAASFSLSRFHQLRSDDQSAGSRRHASKILPTPAWELAWYKKVIPGGLRESVFAPLVDRAWTMKAPAIECVQLCEIFEDKKALLLRGVLSEEQCEAMRGRVLEMLADPAGGLGYMSAEEVSKRYRTRSVERLSSLDEQLTAFVSERITPYLPQLLDGGELRGLSPAWRFLHYKGGDHHGVHIDGREPRKPLYDSYRDRYVQSRLTLQLYLSSQGPGEDEFTGGSTIFFRATGRDDKDCLKFEETYEYKPEAGDCLIWYQEEPSYELDYAPPQLKASGYEAYTGWHSGELVKSGRKVVARTVIGFEFPSEAKAVDANSVLWLSKCRL